MALITATEGGKSIASAEIRVRAPARLHLGFLDPGAHLGRRFGSVGVALEGIATEIRIRPAAQLQVSGPGWERVEKLARHLGASLGVPPRMEIQVTERIPPHSGLGSGTQLTLAVGIALSRFRGRSADPRLIASLSGRGKRSGIGIAAFEQGGFIVDGGRAAETVTPPLLARLPVPDLWQWLLIFDSACQGLHGQGEGDAFRRLPRFPRERAADLCHRLLIQGLPALAEADFASFCEALAEIQRANGEYFAAAQGGRYTSGRVAQALGWLAARGWAGLGQSSWGPTGFCLLPDPDCARREMVALQDRFAPAGLRFQLVTTRNCGAQIQR